MNHGSFLYQGHSKTRECQLSGAIEQLRQEFERRKRQNAAYSLRAFARDSGVSSGALSEILAGQRRISLRTGQKLAMTVFAGGRRQRLFLKALTDKEFRAGPSIEQVRIDEYATVAEWHHLAILNLTETEGFQSDPAWIGRRLGIHVNKVKAAIERMVRLGMLESNGGELKRTGRRYEFVSDAPSEALKKSHQQTLEQAIAALYNQPLDMRTITSMTLPTDPGQVAKVKDRVAEFMRDLAAELGTGPKTEVFNLNIQFHPVTSDCQEKGNTNG